MDNKSKEQVDNNSPNAINVEEMDLDDFAFDDVEEENLAENVKNVDSEKAIVQINSSKGMLCETKLEKEKPANSTNLPDCQLNVSKVDFSAKNALNFGQLINTKMPQLQPITPQKDWQMSISKDLRNHLVTKLVKEICPIINEDMIHDQRIKDVISYARKVENDFFEAASDKEAYYHMVAEKIYKIQKELQAKKEKLEKQVENAMTLNVQQQQELANSPAKENKRTKLDSDVNCKVRLTPLMNADFMMRE